MKNGLGIGQQKTATLAAASWNSTTHTQTVTVSGVTTANTVIVTPHPDSIAAWGESGVRCTGQAANSLTFTCDSNPSAAIVANVLML